MVTKFDAKKQICYVKLQPQWYVCLEINHLAFGVANFVFVKKHGRCTSSLRAFLDPDSYYASQKKPTSVLKHKVSKRFLDKIKNLAKDHLTSH